MSLGSTSTLSAPRTWRRTALSEQPDVCRDASPLTRRRLGRMPRGAGGRVLVDPYLLPPIEPRARDRASGPPPRRAATTQSWCPSRRSKPRHARSPVPAALVADRSGASYPCPASRHHPRANDSTKARRSVNVHGRNGDVRSSERTAGTRASQCGCPLTGITHRYNRVCPIWSWVATAAAHRAATAAAPRDPRTTGRFGWL